MNILNTLSFPLYIIVLIFKSLLVMKMPILIFSAISIFFHEHILLLLTVFIPLVAVSIMYLLISLRKKDFLKGIGWNFIEWYQVNKQIYKNRRKQINKNY